VGLQQFWLKSKPFALERRKIMGNQFAPAEKFPGDLIESGEWNEAMTEIERLEDDKVNRSGQETMTGPLTVDGNVGIGTTTPEYKLDLVGDRIRLRNSGKALHLRVDGAAVDLATGTSDLYITSGEHDIIMNPASSDGNVGIGTTTPEHKLDLVGDRIRLRNSGKALHLRVDGDAVDLATGTSNLYIASGEHDIIMNPASSDGKVGIGTTIPSAKLHVNGDFILGQDSSLLQRIVAGRIASNGDVAAGSGFTSEKTDKGRYTVTFSIPFSSAPIVIATCNNGTDDNTICASAESDRIRVRILDVDSHEDENGIFSFIAIGLSQ
jgi:hypothetical protein